HVPQFAAFRQARAAKIDLPTYPFEHRQYWFNDSRTTKQQKQAPGPRTEAVRLLEDGRIEELAALLDGANGDRQTLDVLSKLAAQHNRQRTTQSIADDRYEVRWDESSAPSSGAEADDGSTWILIGDDPDAVQPLLDVLTARGHRHRIIGLPVSDADEEQLTDVLRAGAADDPQLRIVHVAALGSDAAPMGSLLRMQHRVLGGTRRLFRAATAAGLRRPVWVVTRGAQRVTDADSVSPDQSCLWGFGRAAALELPQVWGGLADLSGGTSEAAEWSRFVDRITTPDGSGPREDQIALRDQAIYVPRLVRRATPPSGTPLHLRDDATYLVTGGLGSIGLEIAGYLASHGARHVVLTSRRAPSGAVQQRIDTLGAQHNCKIRVVTADVADAHAVARLLATVAAELPPLAGIVHAAGEIGTTPLSNLDDSEVDRVFAGKVWGAWHLSEAALDTSALKLDFFVCTSSIASVWGGFGQTAYGAANAFLDALAWRLRERGIPGISVNFGPWSAGMADAESRARLDQRGVRTLSPADALAGLADVVAASGAQGAAQGVVARIDWTRFLPLYQQAGRRAFLAELEREVPDAVSPAVMPSGKTPLVERLTNAPVQQRRKLMTDYLRDTVAEVTRVDVAEIREDAGFFDLGMDSL
ncbi:MAG: SDR family NAD(P)-dependent oxidoreductase, partial [Mycobacterium sp.]|nr:SDR family NAD(P)-dependent oxidoreductase [Mycobacterium sp.]